MHASVRHPINHLCVALVVVAAALVVLPSLGYAQEGPSTLYQQLAQSLIPPEKSDARMEVKGDVVIQAGDQKETVTKEDGRASKEEKDSSEGDPSREENERVTVEAERSEGSFGYDRRPGGRGFEHIYYFRTSAPGTILLQKVRATITYRCGDQVVLERTVEYSEWFKTGEDGRSGSDQHFWNAASPEVVQGILEANGCPVDCDPMEATTDQNFEIGVADLNEGHQLEAEEQYNNGASFGYVAGGSDKLRLPNCDGEAVEGDNPAASPFTQGKTSADALTFKDPDDTKSVSHGMSVTFENGNPSPQPGEGHSNTENYK